MNTKSNCCGGTASACDSTIAELPRYYPRQLITPDDLTLEQNYFRNRMRRHNRLLHGWGVVCGALVCPKTTKSSDGRVSFTPWQVQVQQGYVLGPAGDEIIIDCARTVDLRTSGVSGVTGEPCVDAPDPWCSQVFTTPSVSTLYIAVKYNQSMMRPVRVQPAGCGCDDLSCEYSRLHDGYEFGVLTSCPTCSACDPNMQPVPTFDSLTGHAAPPCPDCSCGPWVCLAQVSLSPDGSGVVQQIDNVSCRRMVLSFCNFWWQPGAALGSLTVTGSPVSLGQGKTAKLTVTGKGLDLNAQYNFGPGAGVAASTPTFTAGAPAGTSIDLPVSAAPGAAPGDYTLTVVNPDCSARVSLKAVNVPAPPSLAGANAGRVTIAERARKPDTGTPASVPMEGSTAVRKPAPPRSPRTEPPPPDKP
jgi:hypothetical protein